VRSLGRRVPGEGDALRLKDLSRQTVLFRETGLHMDTQKTALVTGAGSGIGRSAALGLMRAGWRVALLGRRRDKLEETASLGPAGKSLCIGCDVGVPREVEAAFAQVKTEFGRLDLLFNNAGRGSRGVPLEELRFEEWQAVVDANLTGAFLCTQQAFKIMKTQEPRGGRIINNGSISAHAPRPNSAPYTATKHAMTGLTKATSLDGRAYDVACGQIDIGNAETDLAAAMAKGVPQANGTRAVEPLFDVNHVGDMIVQMATLPLDTNVQFVTIMATKMPFVGRG
jgi:NAD(P)-dependent dehydrogenase (short-subunit alcohol dehydrogenase family)